MNTSIKNKILLSICCLSTALAMPVSGAESLSAGNDSKISVSIHKSFHRTREVLPIGWTEVNGRTVYYDESGKLVTGFARIDDRWYYLKPVTGERTEGWFSLNGETYYFGRNGEMCTGVCLIEDSIYRFNENGQLQVNDKRTLKELTDTQNLETSNIFRYISFRAIQDVKKAIREYGDYSVSFVLLDLNTGQCLSYDPSLPLYSASAIKGPYEISVLSHEENAPTDTIYNAIKYSDNECYRYSRSIYGADVFRDWLIEAAVDPEQSESNYVTTTSQDLAKMWLHAWDFLTSDSENAAWARETFQNVNSSALVEELGNTCTVYSKAGWIAESEYYTVYNCAGIVMDHKYPYILALTSNCPAEEGILPARRLIRALHNVHREMVKN